MTKLNTNWIAALAAGLFSVAAVAQTSGGSAPAAAQTSGTTSQSTPAAASETTSVLGSGSILQAALTKSVDAKKAKSGDPVEARLTQDLKAGNKVLLRRGAKLMGHVTEAQARTKENPESKLSIVFDKAIVKGSEDVAFSGIVMAIAPPLEESVPSVAGDPSAVSSSPSMGGQPFGAGRSAGGPSASAAPAVNAQLPGERSTATLTPTSRGAIGFPGMMMKPAAAGSASGTVISSGDHNVKLDSGTQMVVQVGTGVAH